MASPSPTPSGAGTLGVRGPGRGPAADPTPSLRPALGVGGPAPLPLGLPPHLAASPVRLVPDPVVRLQNLSVSEAPAFPRPCFYFYISDALFNSRNTWKALAETASLPFSAALAARPLRTRPHRRLPSMWALLSRVFGHLLLLTGCQTSNFTSLVAGVGVFPQIPELCSGMQLAYSGII